MIKLVIVVFMMLLSVGCAAQGTDSIPTANSELVSALSEFRKLDKSNHANIAPKVSDASRLVVMARAISKETGQKIAGLRIRVFQAGEDGEYHPKVAGDEKTARISGDVTTDSEGRFLISTILPGDYGTIGGNRHIHLYIEKAKPTSYDFFFSNFVSAQTRSWAEGNSQGFLLDLYKLEDGTLVASVDLEVRGYQFE